MLILSRKVGESIIINGNIAVKVIDVNNGNVRLGIVAPTNIIVDREESVPRRQNIKELILVMLLLRWKKGLPLSTYRSR